MDQFDKPLFNLSIEGQTASTISSSALWARVLATCGIIFGAMLIVMGVLFKSLLPTTVSNGYESDGVDKNMAIAAGMGMIMYIIIGGLTILGNVFLLNYANKMSRAIRTNDALQLNSAFAALRNYCAFWAIIMIISLLLFSLGLLMQLAAA